MAYFLGRELFEDHTPKRDDTRHRNHGYAQGQPRCVLHSKSVRGTVAGPTVGIRRSRGFNQALAHLVEEVNLVKGIVLVLRTTEPQNPSPPHSIHTIASPIQGKT